MASGWGARWPCALMLLLLLAEAWVAPALSVAPCDRNEYQPEGSSLCCQLCPAGHYVFRPCSENHTSSQCQICEPGAFRAFPNGESSCQRCSQCRQGDQEVVAECTPTSDARCRCKEGSFYCNSVNCIENCLRCKRCPGAVLSPCNATSNTVCAGDPGHPDSKGGSQSLQPHVSGIVAVLVLLVLGLVSVYCYKKRAKLVSGVRAAYQSLVRLLDKRWSDGSDSLASRSNLRLETMRPEVPETRPSEEESAALMLEAGPRPEPSREPEESLELQVVVVGGDPAAPGQALETATPAAPAAPAAPGPQDGTQAPLSLRNLEERYRTEYFVRDNSQDGVTAMCYEFVKTNLGNHWKMFVRLVGLDETDIDACECENPGNSREQRHQMLLAWRRKLGRDATVFRLLAALHKLELHMYLQNIINNLVAQGVLGRHVDNPETSD